MSTMPSLFPRQGGINNDLKGKFMTSLSSLLGQSNPKFELQPATNGQWFWRFKAGNGETLCHSETYSSKQMAEHGIQSLITNIKNHF